MADKWAREWQIFGARGDGAQYLGPGTFTLEAVPDPQIPEVVAFYRVTDISEKMDAHWLDVRFFPRGSKEAPQLSTLLAPWDKDHDEEWNSAADSLRSGFGLPSGCIPGINPEIYRLEGDMRPQGTAEALTLVRSEEAVQDGTELLIVMLKSVLGSHIDEDGTAHGGRPH